jgi:hypothetical protein
VTEFEIRRARLRKRILEVQPAAFDELALDIFRFQYEFNVLYREFVDLLSIEPASVSGVTAIPSLPISFFKRQAIQTGEWESLRCFRSSGTVEQERRSMHYIRDLDLYRLVSRRCFRHFYDFISGYRIWALLPGYSENPDSSLITMVNDFIKFSGQPDSAFVTAGEVWDKVNRMENITELNTILFGVTFALLDLTPGKMENLIIMETGGMKGRREELTREEVHAILTEKFAVDRIHSEYGMTELFSQAYSKGGGTFHPGPTLRVYCRDFRDPLGVCGPGISGLINAIDLGNLDSCAFIATDDVGRSLENGGFEVLGRADGSEPRGCNLLYVRD